jgi:aminopeptidase N
MGAIGEQEIAAEQERDHTIQGTELAAGARAARPTAEAKAAAWERAVNEPSIPNGTHRTLAANFAQYDQDEVLAPYYEKYLELCEQISRGDHGWHDRGHASTQTALTWLFPIDGDQAWVTRVDEWLASTQPSDQVRRTVTERRDATARALRVQALG